MATNKRAKEHAEAQARAAAEKKQAPPAPAAARMERPVPTEPSKAVAALSMCSIVIGIVAFFVTYRFLKLASVPAHLQGHPVFYQKDLISGETAASLRALVHEEKEFATFAQDDAFYNITHLHIGEAVPVGADGKCSHPFLVPTVDKSLCVLPGRIDIARHYFKSGGIDGLKEDIETLASRVQAFSRYHFRDANGSFGHPTIQRLFQDKKFSDFARSVCPKDKQYVDPFQLTTVANIPGQTVAVHIDAPIFWGADRFHVPQWLLATMVFSGLFKDRFVDQIQVVAYFHQWGAEGSTVDDGKGDRGGRFLYWDDDSGLPKSVEPLPLSGSAVDGSKVLHTANTYFYRKGVKPPVIDKSAKNVLAHDEVTGKWRLVSNGKLLTTMEEDDLRFSAVYRARCFKDEQERDRFLTQQRPADMIPLESILDTLISHAVEKRLTRMNEAQMRSLSRLDLALELMDAYVRYPSSPTAAIPINYCAAQSLLPPLARTLLTPVFKVLCD